MVSHGLIGASLFFLVGATYDRTHTLQLDEMGGVGQKMRKMFALWTVCSLASLALPGMSGFVSELMVFVGFATSEAYSLSFRIVIAVLAAIGVILTPIYLLSMLREIFFGKENAELVAHTHLVDAEPREIYVISCLLVPIIGIGLYPRLITDSYRSSIEALVGRELAAMARVSNPPAAALMRQPPFGLLPLPRLEAPSLPAAALAPLWSRTTPLPRLISRAI
jgi:NAD(P)H-quinone oxidoreductase subunit 4